MSAPFLAFGRLLRLSLAPSALADGAAGLVLGAGAWPRGAAPVLLLAASAGIYHGGMALNDWADRGDDARLERGRPLETGAIRPRIALILAVVLLALGSLLAWQAAPRCGLVLGTVAACAVVYDLAGRGPVRGPFLLGVCRAGNLGGGLALASTFVPFQPVHLAAPLAYGLYVYFVSRLARLEDASPEARSAPPRGRIASLAAGLMLIGLLATCFTFLPASAAATPLRHGLPLGLAAFGSFGLWRTLPGLGASPWHPSDAERVAGMGLRRLLVATAALALGAGSRDGVLVALAILCGYPLSHALRRVFPPT